MYHTGADLLLHPDSNLENLNLIYTMTDFMSMVRESVKNGANQDVMWNAVSVADEILDEIKKTHPEKYDHYMREMSEALFGCHYTESLAMADVEKMHHTNKEGQVMEGNYWTPEQVEEAWAGKKFPKGTTKYDKWVISNAIWHDTSNFLDDKQVLEVAYNLFFADEDSNLDGKVWKYMSITK